MPSTLVQELYLRELPPGLNVSITNVKPSVPIDKEWEVEFVCNDVGSVSITGQSKSSDNLSGQYPINAVATSTKNQGLIGVVKFGGYRGLYSSGTGGKVDITIRIQGTADVNGNSYSIDMKGYMSVSTTNWKGFERPDYTTISYYWGDTAPAVLLIDVPHTFVGKPADACFSFGVSVDGDQIVVSTTLHKRMRDKVMDYLVRAIFFSIENPVST